MSLDIFHQFRKLFWYFAINLLSCKATGCSCNWRTLSAYEAFRCQSQERMARWPKTNNGKGTAFYVMLRACVSVTRVLEFSFGRLGVTTAHASWLAQLDCRVLIGAGGSVGALIGQSACRLLACARAAIDSTHARPSDSLRQAATTRSF